MASRAVVMGINDYASIGDLRGCLSDVENVSQLLGETFQFDEVKVYRDEEVVKEAVEEAFDWLAQDAAPGDRRVFHFSGHGSYITSVDDDEPVMNSCACTRWRSTILQRTCWTMNSVGSPIACPRTRDSPSSSTPATPVRELEP